MQPFKFNFGFLNTDAGCGEEYSVVKSPAQLFQPELCTVVGYLPLHLKPVRFHLHISPLCPPI